MREIRKLGNNTKTCFRDPILRQKLKKAKIQFYLETRDYNFLVNKGKKVSREDYAYQVWRELVLKRDNYTCRICGSKKNVLPHGNIILYGQNRMDREGFINLSDRRRKNAISNFLWQ